ncbi:hemolysin D [Aliterella atlantica CENA595]|uniref:Hemolysin D n=1 Tax=Aliterella atlantica CENA595 TaxID=1618023 RepID=A0A0D8ZUS8_9CYAN|nr:hemolysin D [Aliterella atlantica CENA595]
MEQISDKKKRSSSKKRTWIGILGAILLLAGAGIGLRWLHSNAQSEGATGGQPPGVSVVVAPVQLGTIAQTSDYVASIQSRKSVTLQPQIDGRIEEIFVQPGTFVKAGAPIMQINPAEQQAAVRSSSAAADANRAAIENQRSTLNSLQAERQSSVSNLSFSQEQYKRYASLYREGAVTRQQLDEYTDRLRAAQASLGQIDARIKAQQAAIAQARQTYEQSLADVKEQQVQLQYYRVTAPFGGTVGNIPVKIGDRVTTETNLANLTENQNLEVNIAIPIERAPDLRVGMPVELLNAQGEVVGTSRVFFISPNVNNDTQSVLVKASYANDSGNLRADQFIRARVIWDRSPGVLVPTTAISRIAGQDFVFVAAKNENSQMVAQQKPVKLGEIQGNNYPVLEGLKPGDEIVTSGIQKLSNGAPIVPES